MSTQVQFRRGTTANMNLFAGAVGEITVDTTKKVVVVHDGSTLGGNPMAPANNPSFTGTVALQNALSVSNGGTGLTSLTAGYIPYGNGTGAFGSSSNLFWDSANSRLGIGTTTPQGTFHSNGTFAYFTSTSAYAPQVIHWAQSADSFASYIFLDKSRSAAGASVNTNDNLGAIYFRGYNSSGSVSGSSYLSSSVTAVGSSSVDSFLTIMSAGSTGYMTLGTNGSERLRITSSGDVGIGTSSPSGVLHAYKASSSSAIIAQSQGTTSADVGLFAAYGGNYLSQLLQYGSGPTTLYTTGTLLQFLTSTSAPIIFTQNTTEAMRIDASGNLGLGVTPSAWYSGFSTRALQVGPLSSISYDGWTGATNIGFNAYQSAATTFNYLAAGIVASRYSLEAGAHKWFTTGTTTGSQGGTISFTQAMTLDASGNLGVGTTSPANFGGVNLQVQNSNIGSILWSNGTHVGQLLASAAAEVSIGSRSNSPLRFGTNDTERARIDSSGNLLVGTTSSPSGSNKLRVANSILDDLAIGSGAHFDTSNATPLTIATGSNELLISGSAYYLVLISERNQTGQTALFLLANGTVTLISQNGGSWVTGTTPAASEFSIGSSGGNYRVYNGYTGSATYLFSATIIRCF